MEKVTNSVFSAEAWGRIIDGARMKYGINVKELCKGAGMSASTYTKFEKGSM